MDPKSVVKLLAATAFFFFVTAVFFFAAPTGEKDFSYCDGKHDYAVNVTRLHIDPIPFTWVNPPTFSVFASTGSPLCEEAIVGGKLVIDVSYWGFPVHSETRDLCTETSCPVAVGDFVIKQSQSFPIFNPPHPGSYQITMKMFGSKGEQLTCISFGFFLSWNIRGCLFTARPGRAWLGRFGPG